MKRNPKRKAFKTIKTPEPSIKPWVFETRPKFARIELVSPGPLVDVFEETGQLDIILNMPGYKEEDIRWEAKDNVLKLSANLLGREWKTEIPLPKGMDTKNIKTKYQNAILEISLIKKKGAEIK